MKITQKQIENVLSLPPEKLYSHFIKTVVDWEEVWGLYNDGWAMAGTNSDESVFLFWPAKEYAQLNAISEWKDYKPEPITLDDFIGELLPKLAKNKVLPGIFFRPNGKGLTPSIEQLIDDLNKERENY